MLVQFKAKNFYSFRDEIVLDMSAIQAYKEHEYNLISLENGEKVNKIAAIYGANASGKSNLMRAFESFVEIILESMNNASQNHSLAIVNNYHPYFNEQGDIEFELTMVLGDNEYRYGFEYNNTHIVSEWLYQKSLNTSRTTVILERDKSKLTLGATIRKECGKYKDQIPVEALALSFYNKLKLETKVFQEIYEYFNSCTVGNSSEAEEGRFILQTLLVTLSKNKQELLKFVQAIDTGIVDIYYEQESGNRIKLYTVHHDIHDKPCTLALLNESQGTLKAMVLYGLAQEVISKGSIMMIDELNANLHPLLLKYIIDLFYKSESKAQLIYTTHDTTLLDKKFFRRDQIWFVQKDKFGCSELSALSDFKVRSDASFEKDYLAGVYGGIPFLKNF